jgi:hypothetical protein
MVYIHRHTQPNSTDQPRTEVQIQAGTVATIPSGPPRALLRTGPAGPTALITRASTHHQGDAPSMVATAATSDFTVYSDRFGGYSGASGPESVSQVVSRRHRRCDLRIGAIGQHGTARPAPHTVSMRVRFA